MDKRVDCVLAKLHEEIMDHATMWAKFKCASFDWHDGIVTGLIYAYMKLCHDEEVWEEYFALLGGRK